jgi:fatty-acyl-CoA synthase
MFTITQTPAEYAKCEEIYRTRRLTESCWYGDTGHELLDSTIPEWLRKNAKEVPDQIALIEGIPDASKRRTWTYAELLRDAEQVATALLNRFEPGDHISVMAANIAEYVILQYGLALAGMVTVTLNPAYHKREIDHVLRTADVVGVFVMNDWRGNKMRDTIEALRPDLPLLGEVFDIQALDAFVENTKPVELPEVKPSDPAVIMFTSGTTGTPRGALLNHFGMTNSTRFMAINAGLPEGGIWIGVMPMQHMGGYGFTVLGTLQRQGTVVLALEFNTKLFYELTETYKVDYALLVPTMVEAVLDYPEKDKYDISSLKFIQSGASKVEKWLVERVDKEIGCQMSIVCGQTEAHGGYSQTHLDDSPADKSETIGQPYPLCDFKIGDRDTGEVLPLNTEGEICVRGYQVMVEYYNDPEATAITIDKDGWLHSGDLGTMDERGFVKFTGRLKEMLIRGGVNIYPAEIETLLLEHPKVFKVAVVGVPDNYWGEQVAAVIIPKSWEDLPTLEELDDFCLDNIARFKRPRFYSFVKEFPFTSTGKLRKFQLKEDIAAGAIQLQEVEHKEKIEKGEEKPTA